MKILIIGGTGFISLQLVKELSAKGHEVFAYSRGNHTEVLPANVINIIGDRNDIVKLKQAFSRAVFDLVIDMCAYDVNDIKLLLEALPYKVSHYIFCSTLAVYDFPYNSYLRDGNKNAMQNYGYKKLLCERLLKENINTTLSIIRPTYVYGPNDPTYRIAKIIEMVSSSQTINLPTILEKYKTQFIFIDDLIRAFCSVIESQYPQSGEYDIVYPETVNFITLIRHIGQIMQKETKLNFTDKETNFPFELYSNQLVNAKIAWEKLGINPEFNLEKGLKITIDSWKASL